MISKIHSRSRMHPIVLFHKIFEEEHTLESSSNKIEQCYTYGTARQSKGVLQFLPIHSSLSSMFERGFLPLIIHSGTPPPPRDNYRICDHNAMLAFPQEKISHYTTACNTSSYPFYRSINLRHDIKQNNRPSYTTNKKIVECVVCTIVFLYIYTNNRGDLFIAFIEKLFELLKYENSH